MAKNLALVYLESEQTKNSAGQLVAEVGAVKFGEHGYYPTTYGLQTREWVDAMNERLGLTWAEAQAMETCSMFTWATYDMVLQRYASAGKPPIVK